MIVVGLVRLYGLGGRRHSRKACRVSGMGFAGVVRFGEWFCTVLSHLSNTGTISIEPLLIITL